MELKFAPELESFREEVRQFVEKKIPTELKQRTRHEEFELTNEEQKAYVRLLNEQGGWSCPPWPEEHGGPGWSHEQQYVFERELALRDAPRVPLFGSNMLGAAVLEFGSTEQKSYFLPKIVAGEMIWCQGYSEPGAGSDLASLQCRAVREGDEYIINGSKLWTSDGHNADWMFGLFRTDNSGKKQFGITVLLLPMNLPGLELKSIGTFDGGAETNATFFDNVRVPVTNRLGEENQGWTVAKHILGNERFGTAEVSRSAASLARLKTLARSQTNGQVALINDDTFSQSIGEVEVALPALEATEAGFLFGPGGPDAMGPEASMLKIQGTIVQQRILELNMEAIGYYGLPDVPEQLEIGYNQEQVGPEATGYASRTYFNMRKTSIYSGSNEIQKNIIAKAVLGL